MPQTQPPHPEGDISPTQPANQRILVCLGPGPGGPHLVQTAWEMALAKNAEWFVLHVDTPAHATGSEDGKDHVAQTLLRAEQLGAKTFKIYGLNILDEIISFVRQHDIKTVYLGRSRAEELVSVFLSQSLADKLVHHLTDSRCLSRRSGKTAVPGPWTSAWSPGQILARLSPGRRRGDVVHRASISWSFRTSP